MMVREYRDSDLDAVLSAWENASRLAHPFLTEQYFVKERKIIPKTHLPDADTWVIEIGNQVVGFIAMIGNEVGAIFVQPAFHNRGAGSALLSKAQALYGELEVDVFSENVIGRQFYSRHGFVAVEEKMHADTGQAMLRLKLSAGKAS